MTMGSSENAGISVITVPFPAQGHLNQMLQLSSLISSYGISVHYAGSARRNSAPTASTSTKSTSLIFPCLRSPRCLPNAESYAFNCLSAYCQVKFGKLCPIPRLRELQPISEIITEEIQCFVALQNEALGFRSGDIYNTCRLIEGPFLEILAKEELAGQHPLDSGFQLRIPPSNLG